MVRFNDDLILSLYGLLEFDTFCNARIVCKWWNTLSYNRSVLHRFYDKAHLERAFGPTSWHDRYKLMKLLLRNHRLDLNLDSDKPTVRSHRIYDLPKHTATYSHDHRGPFLFFLHVDTLECFNLGDSKGGNGADALETLWTYSFASSDEDRRICNYESRDMDEPGCSMVTLALCSISSVTIFKLHVRRSDKLVQVTQRDICVYPWMWRRIEMLEIQGDWILGSEKFGRASLLHAPSSRPYFLRRDPGHHHSEIFFASQRYIASFVMSGSVGTRKGTGFAIYEIPDPKTSTREIEWTYCVLTKERIHGLRFLSTHEDTSTSTTIHLIAGIIPEGWRFDSGEPEWETSMQLLSISFSPNTVSYRLTPSPGMGFKGAGQHNLRAFEIPKDLYYSSGFPLTSNQLALQRLEIFQVSIAPDEDGSHKYGKLVRLPMPDGLSVDGVFYMTFDELRGELYVFKKDRGASVVHVVSFI